MRTCHSRDHFDALISDHKTLQIVDQTIAAVRVLGLQPQCDVIRQQAALYGVEREKVELLVALMVRRLTSIETPL